MDFAGKDEVFNDAVRTNAADFEYSPLQKVVALAEPT
jgi:hypothetical protein